MKPFPTTAEETRGLALRLVRHLEVSLKDTKTRPEWTAKNFEALRSFSLTLPEYKLQSFPDEGCRKGAFLWDYIAYQQDVGILIAAETEHDRALPKLKEDFEKLLYVRSPIKVFMFWLDDKDERKFQQVVSDLSGYMKCCSEYSPGEVFILYCRTWENPDGKSGDWASWLQIKGEPCHVGTDAVFERVPVPDFRQRG